MINVPMETISDSTVKMHCYKLLIINGELLTTRGSRFTIKAIAIPSPWNKYPRAQIASALELEGSKTTRVLKAIVPTSI